MGPDTEERIKAYVNDARDEVRNLVSADIEALKNLITQDLTKEVREIRRKLIEDSERNQKREAGVKRHVMGLIKALWPD